MGKSPGKWIKGILFGKKSSKTNLSKGRELSRSASEKPARVSSKEPISTVIDDAPLISYPVPVTVDKIDTSSIDKGEPAILASDCEVSSSPKKDGDKPSEPDLPNDQENISLERAATVVQASFRSYQARREFQTLKGIVRLQGAIRGCLARREFQTLKGIVRLQGAIRGCLVRRQAVATLFCMQGIIKLQAITRGYIVRQSIVGTAQCRKQSPLAKDMHNQDSLETKYKPGGILLKNAFINALLASSPTGIPLHFQYSPEEPNSAWAWLLRWSKSQAYAPNSEQKETVESEQTKPKCKGRKQLSLTLQHDPIHADSDTGKPMLKGRKSSSPSVKSAQESPKLDEGKLKHGLKKIQKPTGEISSKAGMDVNKTKKYSKKLSKSPAPKSSERTINTPIGKTMEGSAEAAEDNDVASTLELSGVNSPANQSTPESTTRVPSYMATTASSKAKVKSHVSPRLGLDAVDLNALTRRHSLPSSINEKLISSPRVQGVVQANGKEGIKIDRSLSSSRDITDKGIQVDWKR